MSRVRVCMCARVIIELKMELKTGRIDVDITIVLCSSKKGLYVHILVGKVCLVESASLNT